MALKKYRNLFSSMSANLSPVLKLAKAYIPSFELEICNNTCIPGQEGKKKEERAKESFKRRLGRGEITRQIGS